MDPIFLYRQPENGGDCPKITSATVRDDSLVVGYEDGSTVSEPFRTAEGQLHLVLLPTDEVYVDRSWEAGIIQPLDLDEIARRLSLWIGSYSPLAPDGSVPASAALGDICLELKHADGDEEHIPLVHEGAELRAIWIKDQLVGFDHGGDRGEVVDRAMLARIQARLVVMGARVRKDWHIVKDECVRLGGTPPTDLKAGDHVKIGFQPDHPMPDDFHAEWMWILLTGVSKDGARLTGRLQNHPSSVGIKYGERVRFSNRDVYAVEAA